MRLAPKLIDIAAGVDPRLRLEQLDGVGEAWRHEQYASRLMAIAIIAVVASVLLLSGAGIYAMMSFTVASRRREIGIRSALGANPRHVLLGVFRRAGAQLGAGVLAGTTVAAALDRASAGGFMGGKALILLPSVVVLMCTVGLFAALGPARRSLAVQPAEALRDE
jgi:ABC-type antimicrobial peptide transport system permease subunit